MSLVRSQDLNFFFLFFFNDTATTEIYTLSLHDALPISRSTGSDPDEHRLALPQADPLQLSGGILTTMAVPILDRKSTRLNSSHTVISYAVFCLKKKKEQ